MAAAAAAAVSEEKKLSLKIMVDIKAKKVVFAEADKEFIDFIFNLMSLPLSAVTKVLLLNEKGSVGCLGSLYKSIESLSSQYFEPNLSNNSVLKPKASVTLPLLSLYDYPSSDCRIFRCANGHTSMSDVRGSLCKSGCGMVEMNYTYVTSKKVALGYVKGAVVYMVMDNLEVKPMSISLIKSLVKDFEFMEERQVQVGLQEGLAILKASLETSNVLTSVFLKKI
ncbi:uncharacterized protein LOC141644103 [Silene latifolia]|uniref:uncharacterized protein LOC141644103 n=1 Tax=Silene latifolia TaxID=37657 RepID=UPI003D76EE44